MKNFKRGGRDRGERSFGGDRGSKFGGRGGFGGGRTEMHRATCSECGDDCEVPFKPTGSRPVFCSKCFDKQGGGSDRPSRFGGERRERSERPSKFTRPYFDEKAMFDATCDQCGVRCQVPFRPSPGKPVYCDNCFGKGANESSASSAPKSGADLSDQIKALHVKMDKILKLLNIHGVEVKEEKISKNDKVESKKTEEKKEVKKEDKKTGEVKKAPVAKKEKAPVKAKAAAKKIVAKKKK